MTSSGTDLLPEDGADDPEPGVQSVQARLADLLSSAVLAPPTEDHVAAAAHEVDMVRPRGDVPQADIGGGGGEEELRPPVHLQPAPAQLAHAGVAGGGGGGQEGEQEESGPVGEHGESEE